MFFYLFFDLIVQLIPHYYGPISQPESFFFGDWALWIHHRYELFLLGLFFPLFFIMRFFIVLGYRKFGYMIWFNVVRIMGGEDDYSYIFP